MTAEPQTKPCATRRGVLLGVGLAGLGGALAGCSTAAVPYNANEAGQADQAGASATAMATGASPSTMGSPSTADSPSMAGSPSASAGTEKGAMGPKVSGTVLGTADEIPVGGGKIFKADKVVVTQPVKGTYLGFSAVCTHVGCIVSEVANGTIDCPCHGSEFKITTGAVVTGPAPRPLPKKTIKVVEGKVVLL
jgi:Rieske Fe-S protein